MNGKERCRILKEIRKKIAEENDIALITGECRHKGDCPGTCPKCEAELRYLEKELEERRKKGLRAAVAGISAALTIATASCVPEPKLDGDMAYEGGTNVPITETEERQDVTDGKEPEKPTAGVIPFPGEIPEETAELLDGELPMPAEENTADGESNE